MRCICNCTTFNTHATGGREVKDREKCEAWNLESPELISACRAHLLTSITILLHPPSLSLGVGFPLPSNSQNRRQIYAHPLVLIHTCTTAP